MFFALKYFNGPIFCHVIDNNQMISAIILIHFSICLYVIVRGGVIRNVLFRVVHVIYPVSNNLSLKRPFYITIFSFTPFIKLLFK